MASGSDSLYITFVDIDRDLLKIWGQRNRVAATYIEKQLLHLVPEFKRTQCPNPSRIRKGMFCFAKYTDDNYYRARVFSNVQGDCVGIHFVDYGNKDFVNISNIRMQDGREGDVLSKMSEQAEEYYLARVVAPLGGWTKAIVSEIRRDICCDEFVFRVVDQVGDQKILEIQFRNQGFSDYLIKKQIARPISLAAQKQLILSYCSLVANEQNQNNIFRDMAEINYSKFSLGIPNQGGVKPPQSMTMMSEQPEVFNYGKPNAPVVPANPVNPVTPVNFSQPPPSSIPPHYASTRHVNPMIQNQPKIPKRPFYPSQNAPNSHPIRNESQMQMQTMNPPQFNPMPSNQYNPSYQLKANPEVPLLNNVMIEALAHQLKEYITQDKAKSGAEAEKTPHNYVSSVLEVGSTHNVFISNIDDGPWSFSIQLLSSESELNKLMEELTSVELVQAKPPYILGHPCIGSSVVYGNLCRGVIVSVSHAAVKVYFVDFGSTEDLPSTSIYELPPKFFKTRVLSQKFSLSGLQKVTYSDDIKRCFKEVVQDELLMLRVTSLEGDNLPTCELYHKDRNIKRLLNEKFRDLKTQDEPLKIGDVVDVVVTWVEGPDKFYLQLRSKDAELNALKKELANTPRTCQPFAFHELCVGLRCICQYLSDQQWYRATIISLKSEKSITVFYIDYGNMETVNISLLRKVDGNGLVAQMGVQALQCCLKGFENKSVDQAEANYLESLILEKDLKMKVLSVDKKCYTVELYDNNEDVAFLLTEYSQKLAMGQNKENVSGWKDSGDSGRQVVATKSDQKFRYSGGGDSFERKEKSFRPDSERPNFSREKNVNSRQYPEIDRYQPTHTQSRRRFDDWRDDHSKPSGERTLKREKESNWNEKKTYGGTSSNGNSDKSGWGRDRGGKQMEGWSDSKRNDSADSSDWRDRSSNKWKQEESKGQRKRFGDDNTQDKGFGFNRDSRQNDFGGGKKKFSDDRGDVHGSDKVSIAMKRSRHPMDPEETASCVAILAHISFDPGDCEKVIVTFYESPDEFYVQIVKEDSQFRKMMDDIQIYYKDKYSIKDPHYKGELVISEFSEDKVLYRGEIIKTSPPTVRYVDYGNHEVVRPKCTWPMAKKFMGVRKQALHCRLAKLKPVGSDWLSSKADLKKYFEAGEYEIKFLCVTDGVNRVALRNLETGKDVASEIIAAGLGLRYAQKKSVEIEKIDFSLLPNQLLKLFVSHVENSSKFYVVLNRASVSVITEDIKSFLRDDENIESLERNFIKPGTKCLSTNGNLLWHRGTITEVIDNRVILRYDDTGDCANVAINKVIEIPEFLKDIPPQAIECSLEGISGKISAEEEENFKNMFEQKSHLVHIKSVTGERLSVILYDCTSGEINSLQKTCCGPERVEPIGHLPIMSHGVCIDVSHYESPEELYIQKTSTWGKIETISAQLAEFYDDVNEVDETEEMEIELRTGMLVAARSAEHGTWFRARVQSFSSDKVEIFYIDYGNREKVPIKNVRKLDFTFYDAHIFAAKVSLPVKYDSGARKVLKDKVVGLFEEDDGFAYFCNVGGKLYVDFVVRNKALREDWKLMDGVLPIADIYKRILLDRGESEGRVAAEPATETMTSYPNRVVLVSQIDGPNQFWIHNEGSILELRSLQEKLEKQFSFGFLREKQKCQVGDLFAVYHTEMWHRVEVIQAQDEVLTVRYIDYGYVMKLKQFSGPMKELPPDIYKVPGLASRCSLKGTWGERVSPRFKAIVMQNEEPLRAVILEEGNPTIVDLIRNGQSITEKLLEEFGDLGMLPEQLEENAAMVYITHDNSPTDFYVQRESCTEELTKVSTKLSKAECFEDVSNVQENEIYAAKFSVDGEWYRVRVLKKLSDGAEVMFIDYGNTSVVTELKRLPEDVANVPPLCENYCLLNGNYSDQWSENACEKFSEYCDERRLKMKIVVSRAKKPLVKLFDRRGFDIREEMDYLSMEDGRENVYVSHVNSPTDFYIQYLKDEDFKKIMGVLEKDGDWDNLEDRKPGTLCQACFDVDGLWYRAKVLRNLDNGCEVFFIDYGNVSVSTNLRKLPPEIEEIPPRALRCSLNLPQTNIPESVKEEFILLTDERVLRVKIITPGEVNIVSLKLDGRILEETLFLDVTPEGTESNYDDLSRPADLQGSLDDETDDDKNSKKIGMGEHYLSSILEEEAMAGSGTVRNETDEEKRVKIASGVVDGGLEGFKSDDEKGISESGILSSIVNATDNELIEESQESQENVEESTNDDGDDGTEDQEVGNEVTAENEEAGEKPEEEEAGNEVSAEVEGEIPEEPEVGNEVSIENREGEERPEEPEVGNEVSTENREGEERPEEQEVGNEVSTENREGGERPEEQEVGNEVSTENREGEERPEEQEVGNVVSIENEVEGENPEEEPHSESKTENEETFEMATAAEETDYDCQSEGNKDENLAVEGDGKESEKPTEESSKQVSN